MGSVNDIYQIKLRTSLSGQILLNDFYYRAISGADIDATDLAGAFYTDFVIGVLLPNLSSAATVTQIQVVNGMDNSDQAVLDISEVGANGAARLPSHFASSFRRRTIGVGARYSYKRFGGMVAALAQNGTWTALYQAYLQAIATFLGTNIEADGGAYEPCQITGGFILTVTPTFKQVLTGDWQYGAEPTTQNTRKSYTWFNVP